MKTPLILAALGLMVLSLPAAADPVTSYPFKKGDFLVRARAIELIPQEDQSVQTLGGEVDISNEMVPEIDFSYFLHDRIALELIAATARHDVALKNSAAGAYTDLGKVNHLPPTLLLQYHHPQGLFDKIFPYAGVGVNYTLFYNEDAPGGTVTSVDYKNGWGYALQAGFDVPLTPQWSLNFDVKKLYIDTKVDVGLGGSGSVRADVDIDPVVVGMGVGYKF